VHTLATTLAALALAAAPSPPPDTPRRPVSDTYHGVTVTDDYRWLEAAGDPAVQAWSEAQNARTRAFLDALPGALAVKDEVDRLVRASSVRYLALQERGGTYFALKWDPRQQQPVLVALRSLEAPGTERVLLDPNRLDAKGDVAIDFFEPSLDGKLVAVSLSRGGTESGDVHVYDVASAAEQGDVIPRVNGGTAGGSVSWAPDGRGFFYTRYPHGEERAPADRDFYQQVWFHRLGTQTEKDTYELGKELPRIAETELHTARDGSTIVAEVRNGDGGDRAYWIRDPWRPGWTQISRFEDKAVRVALGDRGVVFLVSRKEASRGKVLRVSLGHPKISRAKKVVRPGDGAIEDILATSDRLFVHEIVGGPSRLRVYSLDGKPQGDAPIAAVSAVTHVARAGDDLVFEDESYLSPPAWWRYDPRARRVTPTSLFQTSPARFDDAEVVRETCTSKDGATIPMDVLRPKGAKLDGTNPTLLWGYGAFGISQAPGFSPTRRLWLDRGGVWAVAHARGGGELGEDWHLAGNLTRKQNTFDDFAACARTLVERGYTKPERLAAMGGSAGGLLMGAEIVQHPELFRAVVSFVGVYDLLRSETTSNGQFNVTELGSVKDPAQLHAMLAASPYQNVRAAQLPAVLLLSGENDPRVDPWHSRKFAARLQAANRGPNPILLRTSKTGHGIGSSLDERIAQRADAFSFLFQELGMTRATASN
jgi:prolyl oligopeptidase